MKASLGLRDALLVGLVLTLLNLTAWRLDISQITWVRWSLFAVSTAAYIAVGRREGHRGRDQAGVLGIISGLLPGLGAGLPMTSSVFHNQSLIATLPHAPTPAVIGLTLGLGVMSSALWAGLVAYLFGRPVPLTPND